MHTNQALRAYGCAECTFLTCQGFERYCGGFPEKRKPKRFWKTDPQWKAPKWCPRRKTPAVYRVYHYRGTSLVHRPGYPQEPFVDARGASGL